MKLADLFYRNPCKRCLVQAACRQLCEPFLIYNLKRDIFTATLYQTLQKIRINIWAFIWATLITVFFVIALIGTVILAINFAG